MVGGMGAVTAAAIMAVGIVAAVMGTLISAAGIMAAAIFTPDRPAHSPHTVHSPRIA
jgi:hypothetical protein